MTELQGVPEVQGVTELQCVPELQGVTELQGVSTPDTGVGWVKPKELIIVSL